MAGDTVLTVPSGRVIIEIKPPGLPQEGSQTSDSAFAAPSDYADKIRQALEGLPVGMAFSTDRLNDGRLVGEFRLGGKRFRFEELPPEDDQ